MIKTQTLLALVLAAALAGCASGVKLDEVPVENRSGTSVAPAPAPAAVPTPVAPAPAPAAASTVAPVTTDQAAGATVGPTGVERIVYFDYDSFVIKPEFQALIESHARFLRASAARKVVIEGHTDERGGREYNLALGQKRSEAVRRALGLLGVADGQMEAVSFGKEKPVATGGDEAAWSRNRRAEIAYR